MTTKFKNQSDLEIYFTTLDVPGQGPIVYYYTIQGFVLVGSMEYMIVQGPSIDRKVMNISRYGSGSGVVIIKDNGEIEVKEMGKRKSVGFSMPFPKYKRKG